MVSWRVFLVFFQVHESTCLGVGNLGNIGESGTKTGLNTINYPCIARGVWYGDGTRNEPLLAEGFYCVFVCQQDTDFFIQRLEGVTRQTNTPVSYFRFGSGTGTVDWRPWQRTDNFGCNSPADLASLLGVGNCRGFYFKYRWASNEPERGYIKIKKTNNFVGIVCVNEWIAAYNKIGNVYYIETNAGIDIAISKLVNNLTTYKVYKDSDGNLYIGANSLQFYFIIGNGQGLEYDVKISNTSGLTEL